jgi:predicted RNA-binding Zn-ribbon protein involved in translation (DUF1610 family)
MIPVMYPKESYKCPTCDVVLVPNSITDDWKCATCGTAVTIYTEDHEGRRHTINRLKPGELRVGHAVVIPISGLKHIHNVLAVAKDANGYRIALKEYRVVRYSADELLNCVTGGW